MSVVSLLLAISQVSCQRFTDPAAYSFGQADALLQEGKFDEAIERYEATAEGWPESPEAARVPNAIASVGLARDEARLRALDHTDLEAVIGFYDAPGTPFRESAEAKWGLLSSTTVSQTTKDQWVSGILEDDMVVESTSILGQEQRSGTTFARVSMVERWTREDGTSCSSTVTHTWTTEEGRWRRLSLPKSAELVGLKFQAGDYASACSAASDWLEQDPFSIDAYHQLMFAMARSNAECGEKGSSKADVIRAMMSINPSDSSALFDAITFSGDTVVSKAFLEKMAKDDCVRAGAVGNLAMSTRRVKDRLALLDSEGADGIPSLARVKLKSLGEAGDVKGVRELLTADRAALWQAELDAGDPAWGANWAVWIGRAALRADMTDSAKTWATYALGRDPTHREAIRLLKDIP